MSNNKINKILSLTMLLIIIVSCSVFAQEINNQNYKHNPETKKFEGIWAYKTTDLSITFVLKNYEKLLLEDSSTYADVVKGNVTYIKNGETIFNNENVLESGRSGAIMPFELWGRYKEPEGSGGRILFIFADKNDLKTLNVMIVPDPNILKIFKDMPPIKIPLKLILKKID